MIWHVKRNRNLWDKTFQIGISKFELVGTCLAIFYPISILSDQLSRCNEENNLLGAS